MVIYVDVIFLENLILDFIILLATAIICNRKIHWFRIILGSSLGGGYALLTLILEKNFFFFKIIISLLMVLISFGFNNKRFFLKNLGVFYLTSITFGGSAFLLLFSVSPEKITYDYGIFWGIYPIKMTIIRWNIRICFDCCCWKMFKCKVFKNL